MKVVPFAWKDHPAFIEAAFPAQKVSIEAQCERKANAGQTLTALGSYWKGRKPLILVRACVLASLLPATNHPEADLEIFELLMAMDDEAFISRLKKVTPADVDKWGGALKTQLLSSDGSWLLTGDERRALLGRVLARMPYDERLDRRSLRPEELPTSAYQRIWHRVNAHLGTSATSHTELVEQLGILRFGRRPRLADAFAGGGSIPFEAARLGCDVSASDLNPIACMLTWGAFHVIGGRERERAAMRAAQERLAALVDQELTALGVEHDAAGNRGKAHLYCLEATCPATGWLVPLAPSWVISRNQRVVAQLVPDRSRKRFDIDIVQNATDEQIASAATGTVRGPDMVYELDGVEYRTPIKTLRGERKVGGETVNDLRRWTREEIVPRESDVFRERVYCIQWIDVRDPKRVFYRAPTANDVAAETKIEGIVRESLKEWQAKGLVPDMAIEDGRENEGPIRTRGWTHWHHLFPPRHLLYWAIFLRHLKALPNDTIQAMVLCVAMNAMDRSSKLGQWRVGFSGRAGVAPSSDRVEHVFYSQALHTFFSYGVRLWAALQPVFLEQPSAAPVEGDARVCAQPAASVSEEADLIITDPPYADAIRYEEITEFFIAWLRKIPPTPFRGWIWDSRRALSIRGTGEEFRREMVKAYTALAEHMPANGVQIVMFTHQDARVWNDMAGIFWGAGLRVSAAWYIATETTSELKKGGYVQGTVVLVLRKRSETKKAYKDELVLEIREEVARQINTMIGLNQRTRSHGRSENLFEDSDLQMAGYAAALRVLTSHTHIDGTDMTREALRPRVDGEASVSNELIEFAVAIANEHLVPDGLDQRVWERLIGAERFYLRMVDLEASGVKKLDNYQNFAKAFRVLDWKPLLASVRPNDARLKSAADLKRSEFGSSEFGSSALRAILFAIFEIKTEVESEEVMSHLRDNIKGYFQRRSDVIALADFLGNKNETLRPDEAAAARVLRDLVKGERLGA